MPTRQTQRLHYILHCHKHSDCIHPALSIFFGIDPQGIQQEKISKLEDHYDIRSSTIETEWVKAHLALDADTECVIFIHLNYGKGSITQATRAKEVDQRGKMGYEEQSRQFETVLKVSEHLKYLEPVDLMLIRISRGRTTCSNRRGDALPTIGEVQQQDEQADYY